MKILNFSQNITNSTQIMQLQIGARQKEKLSVIIKSSKKLKQDNAKLKQKKDELNFKKTR